MEALAERLRPVLVGAELTGVEPIGFTGLKTVVPPAEGRLGHRVTGIGRRAKYLVLEFDDDHRILVHLSQAGRLDVEDPPPAKPKRPKGAVVRLTFTRADGAPVSILVREWGTERKAAWWVLAPGDEGPLERLGPEATSDEFAAWVRTGDDGRRVHTILRDQRTVAGVGRGYADDALHRARLSPYASLKGLDADARERLIEAVRHVLAAGLERERTRKGGLSANKLGEHFDVHGRYGSPCPVCGDAMARVSYESYEITYCPHCQTDGKVLADRRTSRFLK